MLQWILEEALPRRQTEYQMAERIMTMNFAAIHTSSNVRWGYCLKSVSCSCALTEYLACAPTPGSGAQIHTTTTGRSRSYRSRGRVDEGSDGQDVED